MVQFPKASAKETSASRRQIVKAGGLLVIGLGVSACGGGSPDSQDASTGKAENLVGTLESTSNIASQQNLALLGDALVTGSVTNGRGTPQSILFDPTTGSYLQTTDWNEYGVAYDQNMGLVDESQAFWWQVTWSTVKSINTICMGGAYPNQPQGNTRWKLEGRVDGTWVALSEGQGGWINAGILTWGGASQAPISADAIRIKAWSDGVNPLKSIHFRGRGGQSLNTDDRSETQKAALIQYLPAIADNSPSLRNLALLSDAHVSGSVSTGRGAPKDILFDPLTEGYATTSDWSEYGALFEQNLGVVAEADAFWWQVQWDLPKFINSISIGGTYPNQPQTTTKWKVEIRSSGTWSTVSEGQGGWISGGIFLWGGSNQTPITADTLRVKAWSDGVNALKSIHFRGRGGQSRNNDDRNETQKATLIQYLPSVAVANILLDTDIGPDCDDAGTVAIMHALADLGEARILGAGVTVSNPWSAPTLDAINTWYKRPDLPIGTLKESGFLESGSPYTENVAKNFPNDLINGINAPDAILAHRKVLAAQADASVTMVAVGPLRNMRNLLNSVGDANSSLNGRDLIAAKVKRLVIMGGKFPSGSEWNIEQDPVAAQSVVNNWPTEIVFSGAEVGASINTGHSLTSNTPADNPVRRAYELYVGANQDRPSWD
jgi:hypothetical protein